MVAMAVETTSGSGGPFSPAVGSWRLGGNGRNSTLFAVTFYRPHVPTLAVVGGTDLGLQTLCLWMLLPALLHSDVSGVNPGSSPLALTAYGRDVSTPVSPSRLMGRDGDL